MQTFLPYADYGQSAASLDQKRLGKQRVEAYQILLQLTGIKMIDFPSWEPRIGRWNHPAMAMWAGHEVELVEYIKACCDEWTDRGYRDTCRAKSEFVLELAREANWSTEKPSWVGIEEIHRSHRSNLLRKDPEFYLPRFPGDMPEPGEEFLEYIWPKTEFELKPRMAANHERMVQRYERELELFRSVGHGTR